MLNLPHEHRIVDIQFSIEFEELYILTKSGQLMVLQYQEIIQELLALPNEAQADNYYNGSDKLDQEVDYTSSGYDENNLDNSIGSIHLSQEDV